MIVSYLEVSSFLYTLEFIKSSSSFCKNSNID